MDCPLHPWYKGKRHPYRTKYMQTYQGCVCMKIYEAQNPFGSPVEKDEGDTLVPIVFYLQWQRVVFTEASKDMEPHAYVSKNWIDKFYSLDSYERAQVEAIRQIFEENGLDYEEFTDKRPSQYQ